MRAIKTDKAAEENTQSRHYTHKSCKHSVNPLVGAVVQKPLDTLPLFRNGSHPECGAVPIGAEPSGERSKPGPNATVYVTLTKQEPIERVTRANSGKALHRSAVACGALAAGSATEQGAGGRSRGGARKDPRAPAAQVWPQERAPQGRP